MIRVHRSPLPYDFPRDQITPLQLTLASIQHIVDVGRGLAFFKAMLDESAARHDADKLTNREEYLTFMRRSGPNQFHETHIRSNRHHLDVDGGVPVNVNLIDVLDYAVDCVMSGSARRGHVHPVSIDADVLMAAFNNTVSLLIENVKVEE